MTRLPCRSQSGFALVAAIFLLVVIAALGAFAVRTTMSQQSLVDVGLLNVQARAATEAGVELAASQLQATRDCTQLSAAFPVTAFTVSYTGCQRQAPIPSVGGINVDIFTVQVTAVHGNYGAPEFVSRTITARIAI